jgi:hypothetical protein
MAGAIKLVLLGILMMSVNDMRPKFMPKAAPNAADQRPGRVRSSAAFAADLSHPGDGAEGDGII